MARDGWNSYDEVRMSIEESFQPIYLSHLCDIAKTMIDIFFSARCITSTVIKPYTPPFLAWMRETCASSMFPDNTVLQRPPWSGTAVVQFLPKVFPVSP